MKNIRITNEELQVLEVEILKAFHDFCEKHQLRYYLSGGTLIGAIRHKGFIPWDDDIDLCMPRPDFEKFLSLLQDGKLDEYRSVSSRELDPNCPSPVTRIYDNRTQMVFDDFRLPYEIGCWIDIFCLDGVEEDEKKRKWHFKKMRLAMDMFICCLTKFGKKRRSKLITYAQYLLAPAFLIIRAFGYKRYLNWIDKLAKKIPYDDSEYVAVIGGRAGVRETMKKADMEPAILVDFEQYKFYTMANYHTYLTNLYGDYMQLPPEDQRVSRHVIQVYRKDDR